MTPEEYNKQIQKYYDELAEHLSRTWTVVVGGGGGGGGTSKPVVRYGVTCKRCNEHYPHAEHKPEFVCYGCKVWG